MSKMIMVPMEALDDFCINCPALDIEVRTTQLTYGINQNAVYQNYIFCKGYPKCNNIARFVKNQTKKEEDQKNGNHEGTV